MLFTVYKLQEILSSTANLFYDSWLQMHFAVKAFLKGTTAPVNW
jgi:hypothetical protein